MMVFAGMEEFDERVVEVINAWVAWSRTHSIDDPKLACCEQTDRLFAALDKLSVLVGAK